MGIDEAIQNLRLELPFTKEDVERNYQIVLKKYTEGAYENVEFFLLLTDAKDLVLDYLPMEFKNNTTIPNVECLKKKKLKLQSKLVEDKMSVAIEEGQLQHIKKELSDALKHKKHICKITNRILLLSSPSEQAILSNRRRIFFLLNSILILCAFTIYHYFHPDMMKMMMIVIITMAATHLLSILISSYLFYRSVITYESYNKQFHESQSKVERLQRKFEKEIFQMKEYDLIIQKYKSTN